MHADQLTVAADLRLPAAAQVAGCAADQRVDRDASTVWCRAGDLVPHDQRRLAEADVAETVQFAAADAAGPYVEHDASGGRRRSCHVLELDVSRPREDQGSHPAVRCRPAHGRWAPA